MQTIIDDSVYLLAKSGLSSLSSTGTLSKKLQAVIAAHKHGIKDASKVLDVSKTSIYLWAKQIKTGDLKGLINKSKHQDGIKLKKQHKDAISKWLTKKPTLTIKEVRELLFDHFNIDISKSTVHRAMQELNFSYITGRKQHYKQDTKAVERFKKKST